MTRSIAEWQAAGFLFEPDEAVAIAQQLITSVLESEPRHLEHAQPPYGPPSADNVFLKPDGSVVCRGCLVSPAVSELGIFLEQLLPEGSPRVPGGLRYTIARALLNVDAPPFDSLEQLSRDLSRHERGDRAEVIRRALGRAHADRAMAGVPLVERRRNGGRVTTLRRELREADARLYQQSGGLRREPSVIDLVAAAPAPPNRGRTMAAAACLAVGFSLIGAGELMHRQSTPSVAPHLTPAALQTAVSDELRQPSVPEPPVASPEPVQERGIITVRDVPTPARSSRPVARRISVKRSVRPGLITVQPQHAPRRSSRGVLDRLRLGWLKHAFTGHSDL
jgi:hypothetical protein